ncbi:MAG: hypothetical protein AB1861_22575 [Cyanobacteriota bacterium]
MLEPSDNKSRDPPSPLVTPAFTIGNDLRAAEMAEMQEMIQLCETSDEAAVCTVLKKFLPQVKQWVWLAYRWKIARASCF